MRHQALFSADGSASSCLRIQMTTLSTALIPGCRGHRGCLPQRGLGPSGSIHPRTQTKASWLPARQAVWTSASFRGSQQPRVSSRDGGPRYPRAQMTLDAQRHWSREQACSKQQARPPAPTLRPQQSLQGSHPARPLLPGASRAHPVGGFTTSRPV